MARLTHMSPPGFLGFQVTTPLGITPLRASVLPRAIAAYVASSLLGIYIAALKTRGQWRRSAHPKSRADGRMKSEMPRFEARSFIFASRRSACTLGSETDGFA